MMNNRLAILGALCGLTWANVALSGGGGASEVIVPSLLEVGDSLPELRLREERCQIIVAFRASCPFCGAAAQRERERGGTGSSFPITWVAPTDDIDAETYREKIHADSELLVSDEVYSLMQVQAVPLSLAIDEDGIVRALGAYSGEVKGDPCVTQATAS